MGPNILRSWPWSFWVTRTSSLTWLFESQWAISYWWSIGTKSLSLAVFEIPGRKHIGVTILTCQGHVTSSVTWPFDSQVAISCRCSIGTKSVSPAVIEIMGPKYIGVMTWTSLGLVTSSNLNWPFSIGCPLEHSPSLAVFEILSHKHIGVATFTFQGHVTSSVTWPFDSQVPISYTTWPIESQWAISYWWSIGTNSVSPAVFRYWAISILGSRPWPLRVTWHPISFRLLEVFGLSYWMISILTSFYKTWKNSDNKTANIHVKNCPFSATMKPIKPRKRHKFVYCIFACKNLLSSLLYGPLQIYLLRWWHSNDDMKFLHAKIQ